MGASQAAPAGTVREIGFANLNTGQATVGTAATLICGGVYGLGSTVIVNHGTTDIFIGNAGVTTATGILLPGVKGASIDLDFAGDVYGVVASGTQDVSFAQSY